MSYELVQVYSCSMINKVIAISTSKDSLIDFLGNDFTLFDDIICKKSDLEYFKSDDEDYILCEEERCYYIVRESDIKYIE